MSSLLLTEHKSQRGDSLKIPAATFGFISAIATSTTFLPHSLIVLAVIFFHPWQLRDPTLILIFFTIMARLVGDWVFWTKFFPQTMDNGENNENWRSAVKGILTSQPPAIKAMSDMVIDALVDGVLVYLAFRASAPAMWILFVFSASHVIGALVQGIVLRFFERKHVRTFSMIVTAVATFTALDVNGIISSGHVNILGLSEFSASSQILFILGAKCLLAGTSVIAKEMIAETIKIETMNGVKA